METKVINQKTEGRQPHHVYIGRGKKGQPLSKYGNPYAISACYGDRNIAIERHRLWLWARITRTTESLEHQPQAEYQHLSQGRQLIAELASLRGCTLACFCKPQACHGDTLARAAEWAWQWQQENLTDDMKKHRPSPTKSVGSDPMQYAYDHDSNEAGGHGW